MAEMLSYVNGKSTGFVWTKTNQMQFADENFAREFLQLFTVGNYKLYSNGTRAIDPNGKERLTYTNEDLTEYSRAFVGFERRPMRGNIEDSSLPETKGNPIDPISVNVDFKDHFPKVRNSQNIPYPC
jgi:uncharacterized protein (DUF1800 family)